VAVTFSLSWRLTFNSFISVSTSASCAVLRSRQYHAVDKTNEMRGSPETVISALNWTIAQAVYRFPYLCKFGKQSSVQRPGFYRIYCLNNSIQDISESVRHSAGGDQHNVSHYNVDSYALSAPSRPTLGPNQSPIQRIPGILSPEVKRPEREADHSPPFNA
jgi:hypothetical protein